MRLSPELLMGIFSQVAASPFSADGSSSLPSDGHYAVLSGDLVASSKLSSKESSNAMQWLRNASEMVADLHPGAVVDRIDTFRHDSWQLLLRKPEISLRTAILLRTRLRAESSSGASYDSRVSIGIGPVELISEDGISNSRGQAFTISGQGLDSMSEPRLAHTSAYATPPLFWESIARGALPLADAIVGGWTPSESRAMLGTLQGWTQRRTAEYWGSITQQAVSDAVRRAHGDRIMRLLRWYEKSVQQALELV